MSVTAEFECSWHGPFEARVQAEVTPRCPRGCSAEFVERVFLTPPSIATERVKNATRIVKDAIDSMGLSDLDISPHTPGDSPAEKNYNKANLGREIKAEVWDPGRLKGLVQSFPADGGLKLTGVGNPYRREEWNRDKKTGQIIHNAPKARATFTKIKDPE